jgi:hypothetical protein
MRLRAVLDERRPAGLRERRDSRHVGEPAIKMSDQDRRAAALQNGFQGVEVHGRAVRVDVYENGRQAGGQDRRRAIHPGVGDRGDPGARLQGQGPQGQLQRVRPIADAKRPPRAAGFGESRFEGFQLGTHEEAPARQHAAEGGLQRRRKGRRLPRQVVEGNAHPRFLGPRPAVRE